MDVIVPVLVLVGVLLLLYALLLRSSRQATGATQALQRELDQRGQEENRRLADEHPLPPADGDSGLTQPPERDAKRNEKVTPSPTNAADQSRCPACGAVITASDATCPSCEISFVTDSSSVSDGFQKWTERTVGPADGICRPPTDICQ